jgi:hypothetical protein
MLLLVLIASVLSGNAYRVGCSSRSMQMSALSARSIRASVVAAVLAVGTMQTTAPSYAANYFGGGSYSEVVAPGDAVIDSELSSSEEFKKGLEGLGKVSAAVKALKGDFVKNNQLDVISRLSSDFNLSYIRSSLNSYSAAFSEDTQKGGDRLIRQVIQGLTELSREANVKEGKTRSIAKTEAVLKRLSAVDESLDTLAAYYKK